MKDFYNSNSKMIYERIYSDRKSFPKPKPSNSPSALDLAVVDKDSARILDALKKGIHAKDPNRVAKFLLETKDTNQYESLHYFYEQQINLEVKSRARVTPDNLYKIEMHHALLQKEMELQIFNLLSNTLNLVPIDLIKMMTAYDAPFLHTQLTTFFAEKKAELEITLTPEEANCCRIL